MSTLKVNNITDLGDDAVVTSGVLDTLAVPAGGILQVVRATDTIDRITTSDSQFVDVGGMSITITPQKANSSILLIFNFVAIISFTTETFPIGLFQITDASNNVIDGISSSQMGINEMGRSGTGAVRDTKTIFALTTPGSTSPATYKLRFKINNSGTTLNVSNSLHKGQVYAMEVAG